MLGREGRNIEAGWTVRYLIWSHETNSFEKSEIRFVLNTDFDRKAGRDTILLTPARTGPKVSMAHILGCLIPTLPPWNSDESRK
jgi:hypothetical protein